MNSTKLEIEYKILGTEDDPTFGTVTLRKNNTTGETVWIKEVELESEEEYRFYKEYTEKGRYKDRLFITNEVLFVRLEETGGCMTHFASANKMYVVMDHLERDMELEIIQRASEHEKDFFPEAEIWYMIESLTNVEEYCGRFDRIHGDVRTRNMYIDDSGTLKYYDSILVDKKHGAYVKTLLNYSKANVPPEQLGSLKAKKQLIADLGVEAEIWAIGLVLLAIASLNKEEAFYEWTAWTVNMAASESAMICVKNKYSMLLYELIKGALQTNPSDRIGLVDLAGFVQRRKGDSTFETA